MTRRRRLPCPALPRGRPNLVLTGFSGSGKTEVGALLGAELAMPFFDLDRVAEARAGRPIAEIFRSSGEPAFRALERQLLRDAAQLSGAVIATGGGAVLHPELRRLARTGMVVRLAATPAELRRRLDGAAVRPLLAEEPRRLAALLAEREPAYRRLGQPLPTTGLRPAEVAAEVARRYQAAAAGISVTIEVGVPRQPYRVLVQRGGLAQLPCLVRQRRPRPGRVALICDAGVEGLALRLAGMLAAGGIDQRLLLMAGGESAKELEAIDRLWAWLQAEELDRGDLVVALGGGALLDAAGFAAATWTRGVPWITVPTTLLAMVDAAIGGKVAIDRGQAKNAVGAVHQPQAVLCDPDLLQTLPPEVAREGLAEVVKCAVLASPLLLQYLARDPVAGALPHHLEWVVEQAVRIKAAHVARDPEDQGVRQALNLGHTYAHGLEAASGYRLSHGHAVALGLTAAVQLGVELGESPAQLPGAVAAALSGCGLLGPPPPLERDRVAAALRADKKRRRGEAAFVVPSPGGATLVRGLALERALEPLWGCLPGSRAPGANPPALAVGGAGRL